MNSLAERAPWGCWWTERDTRKCSPVCGMYFAWRGLKYEPNRWKSRHMGLCLWRTNSLTWHCSAYPPVPFTRSLRLRFVSLSSDDRLEDCHLKDVTGVHLQTAMQELVRMTSINIRNNCLNADGNVYDMKDGNAKQSTSIAVRFRLLSRFLSFYALLWSCE
jgi:hypothetical protein